MNLNYNPWKIKFLSSGSLSFSLCVSVSVSLCHVLNKEEKLLFQVKGEKETILLFAMCH